MIVSLHTPSVFHLPDGTFLKSGANNVDTTSFMKFHEHPTIKAHVEAGTLSYEVPKGGKEAPVQSHLNSLSLKAAQELIGQTIDSELLQVWLKVEKRNPIKVSIDKQLKALGAPTERRSGNTEEAAKNGAHEELKPDFSAE